MVRDIMRTGLLKVVFADMGIVIDAVGLAWMVVSLFLVVHAGRQRLSISWAWLSAILQAFVAAVGGVLVAWAMHMRLAEGGPAPKRDSTMVQLSELSLWVVLAVAILIWTTFLVWLLVERARFRSRGPTLRDGLKSNIYP
jgi:hypothetical protein